MKFRPKVRGVTLDDVSTRDIDDAFWIEPLPEGGWRVQVSIADAAKVVKHGSPGDLSARQVTATKYFAAGNSPMLPREFAEQKLSLWPSKPKWVLVADFELDTSLAIQKFDLYKGVLISSAKLAYRDIPGILQSDTHPLHALITEASKIAFAFLERRRQQGAMVLYDLNNGWITTEEGYLRQLEDRSETMGQIIVQELMIAANAAVAAWCIEREVPVIFRNHQARAAAPDRATLMQQINDAVRIPTDVETLRVRTHMLLDKAEYGVSVLGHYGLNLPAYVHFTSPIRRYADLVNHRQIRSALAESAYRHTPEDLDAIARHINEVTLSDRKAKSEALKDSATRRANSAVESRRLDGLPDKDFERVTKVVSRSGEAPTPAFVQAFEKRLRDGRLPLLSKTVAMTQAPKTEAWKPLRTAILGSLIVDPPQAVSLLAQAGQVSGWPDVQFTPSQSPSRAFVSWASIAFVVDDTLTASGHGTTIKAAKQNSAIALLATIFGLPYEETPFPEAEGPGLPEKSFDFGAAKDPLSVLQEYAVAAKLNPPSYDIEVSGPPHAPTMKCRCRVGDKESFGTASTKQEAKRVAAVGMIAMLRQ